MTKEEVKELLLELNRSRTHLKGVGPTGMVTRHEREAEILHTLAEEFQSPAMAGMAYRADIRVTASRGIARERTRQEQVNQDVNQAYLNLPMNLK